MNAYKDLMITVVKNLNKQNVDVTAGINKMLEIEKKFALVRYLTVFYLISYFLFSFKKKI